MKQCNKEIIKVSNLITDMTLRGAKEDELARAISYSMAVIVAERSKVENGINELKEKYQEK